MLKVNLTSGYCNPPLTRTIVCEEVVTYVKKHTISMYNLTKKGKRKLIAYACFEDWLQIEIVYDNGEREIIYKKEEQNEK